jgi:hypothetical protein
MCCGSTREAAMAQSRLPRLLPLRLLTLGATALAAPALAITESAATPPGLHWLLPALCYGAGLALTLALAARLTPAAWWRRPTARGALILAGGTWACGSALALAAGFGTPALFKLHDGGAAPELPLALASPASPGPGATPATRQATRQMRPPARQHAEPHMGLQAGTPGVGLAYPTFRAHRSLNLRSGAGVGATRLAVIPAGAPLTPTGQRQGDWWQVRAGGGDDGKELTGWVSSLWLRRLKEAAHRPD